MILSLFPVYLEHLHLRFELHVLAVQLVDLVLEEESVRVQLLLFYGDILRQVARKLRKSA